MPKHPSDEADERQLELARGKGDAYREALEYLIHEVAHAGGMQAVKDVVIGFAQEDAEGLYVDNAEGELTWREPDGENCHIEVAVMDADDNRFIPYLDVQVTLFGENDTEYGPYEIPFVWHPGLYHYGRNIKLPGDGTYDVHIRVTPPTFERHDHKNGNRYTRPAEATFQNVTIITGQV